MLRPGTCLVPSAAILLVIGLAQAGELPPKQLPDPVQQAVRARFKDAKVTGASQEKNADGAVLYEVSLEAQAKGIDVMVTPEGAITLIEQEMARKELPKAVSATLDKQYPKARYKRVEQVITVEGGKETLSYYEALLADSKKQPWSVEVNPDGKIRMVEKKKSLDEDSD